MSDAAGEQHYGTICGGSGCVGLAASQSVLCILLGAHEYFQLIVMLQHIFCCSVLCVRVFYTNTSMTSDERRCAFFVAIIRLYDDRFGVAVFVPRREGIMIYKHDFSFFILCEILCCVWCGGEVRQSSCKAGARSSVSIIGYGHSTIKGDLGFGKYPQKHIHVLVQFLCY